MCFYNVTLSYFYIQNFLTPLSRVLTSPSSYIFTQKSLRLKWNENKCSLKMYVWKNHKKTPKQTKYKITTRVYSLDFKVVKQMWIMTFARERGMPWTVLMLISSCKLAYMHGEWMMMDNSSQIPVTNTPERSELFYFVCVKR